MDSLTLELFRRLQAGPYDESGFKHIQRLLGSQRRVLRSKQDLATLTEIAELLEAWAISAEDPQLGASVIAEAAEIAERELRRPGLANELRALPAADGGNEQERPSGARVYAALGRSRVAAGHPSLAIEAFERALDIEAEPEFVRALADLYAQRGADGDREQAADLYFTLGELLGAGDGVAMLRAALAQNPEHAEARALLAQYNAAPAGETGANARAGADKPRNGPPPLRTASRAAEPTPTPLTQPSSRAPVRTAEPTPTPLTQRSTRPHESVERASSPLDLANQRAGAPAIQRPSATNPHATGLHSPTPGNGNERGGTARPSSEALERVKSTPSLEARRASSPSIERVSSTPNLAGSRPNSAGDRIDRLSTPPGLSAARSSTPTTQPYAKPMAPVEPGAPETSALGSESSFERQSSTHAIPEPRVIGARNSATSDRQSSTHVIPDPRPRSAADDTAPERKSSAQLEPVSSPIAPLPSSVSHATPPPLGRRSARQHSTLSGGWNPPASGPAHIRAASNLRFGAGATAAGVSPETEAGAPSLKSTGTRARAQFASAEALADLLPAPEDTGPSVLEIDLSGALPDGPASSLSPVVRDDEVDESPPPAAKRNRLLGAGVALASACIVWLALVLAPRSADPASGSSTAAATSNRPPRSESIPAATATPKPEPADSVAHAGDTTPTREANSNTAPETQDEKTNASSATRDTQTHSAPAIQNAKPNSVPPASDPDAQPSSVEKTSARTGQTRESAKPGDDRKTDGADDATAKQGPRVEATLELAGLRGGKINEAQLAAAIDKTNPKFESCYETALKAKPRLRGRLGFGWTIRPNGKVANVRKLNGAIKDQGLVKCTVDAINTAHFPKPRNKPAEIFLSLEYHRPP